VLILFTGPSLAPSDVPARSDCMVMPPVAQGDIYRAARSRPWGIGLVDGFFEQVPAVWHKEILWALAAGIHVFGAASMGALRAAELAAFGMVGVGRIFEQYRSGLLDADDEVAVAHLSAEHGYKRVSDALVDIRATLEAAVAARACTAALAGALVVEAQAMFYADRTWRAIVAAARARGASVDKLEAWLTTGRVDQKRIDALALVDAMVAARQLDPRPHVAAFAFQRTDTWERALPRMAEEGTAAPLGAFALMDELRLLGDEALYARAIQGALVRGLSEDLTARNGVSAGKEIVQRTALEFRRLHDLHGSEANRAWLDEEGLDAASYLQMMKSEATVRWTTAVSGAEIHRHLPDQLRAMRCHGRLLRLAIAKRSALQAEAPNVDALVAEAGEQCWQWYFGERLAQPLPRDLHAYAERFGYDSVEAMREAIVIERWFRDRSSS
jgi:hypothetical protein